MTRPRTVFIGEPRMSVTERLKTKIIHGEVIQDKTGPTMPLILAESVAISLVRAIRNVDNSVRVSIAGSIRRHVDQVHDIDILVSPASHLVRDCIGTLGKVLWSGPEKVSIHLTVQPNDVYDLFVVKEVITIQIDIRFIPPESWGPGLQYFTGSREHNISLRSIAKAKGLLLNEHGLWDSSGNRVDNNKEGSIYTSLGLRWLPPKYRNSYISGRSKRLTKNDIEKSIETREGPFLASQGEDVSQPVNEKNVELAKTTLPIVIGEKEGQK